MELHQIRYFLAVSRTLNFTRAAEECNVTQPALTRAVRKLEQELGGDLFRRERTNSHLTDLGNAMMPHLQQSYDSAIAAKLEAESLGRGDVSPLAIGISESVGSELIGDILSELSRHFSGLDLAISRSDAADIWVKLEAGEIEFAILAEPQGHWEKERVWMLFDEELVVCTGMEGASDDIDQLASLGEAAWIERPFCENCESFKAELDRRGVQYEQQHRATSESDAAFLVRSGIGKAILPLSTAKSQALTYQRFSNHDVTRSVGVVSAAGRQNSIAGGMFLKMMRSADWSAYAASPAG